MRQAKAWAALLWLGFLAIIAACVTGSLVGFLNPTVILDLIASWPLLAVPALAVVIAHWASPGVRGIVIPSTIIVVTVFALVLHFMGWSWLPSAESTIVVEADPEIETGYLELGMPGTLKIEQEPEAAYEVAPRTIGGTIGPPSVTETRSGNRVEVVASVLPAEGWVRSDGWVVGLGTGINWSLSTRGIHDANLVDVSIDRIRATGTGSFRLGARANRARFDGRFRVTVPASRSVVVVGEATVPDGWNQTEEGWRSPGEVGTPLTIQVTPGSDVEIREE